MSKLEQHEFEPEFEKRRYKYDDLSFTVPDFSNESLVYGRGTAISLTLHLLKH
jgi:hypothetical protein